MMGKTTKKTTVEFIEKARQIHGDKFDYSLVEYTNKDAKECCFRLCVV